MRIRVLAVISVVCLITVSAASRTVSFAPASTFASGASNPTRIWVADLNQDGVPDLVISDSFNSVAILLGNGDGTFQSPIVYAEDFYVTGGVAVADFNGDHKLDLAVVGGDDSGNGLALFLGNGDGTFQPPVYSHTALAGAAIVPVAGDFNGDGNQDIFVGGNGSSEVLLGDGKGHFKDSPIIAASGDGVAVADFNHDGILDAAVSDFIEGEVVILIGHGDGAFRATPLSGISGEPTSIASADLNNDGNLDLAVTLYQGGSTLILVGDGAGHFRNSGEWPGGFEPGGIVSGDFNLDKSVDLAVSDYAGGGITALPGNGTAKFSDSLYFATGNGPASVVAGDFNGDGSLDLAVTNNSDNTFSVLLNASGTFVRVRSSQNPSRVGESVKFTATIKGSVTSSPAPNGTVTFKSGTTVLGVVQIKNGLASFATSSLSQGSHKIVADYSGDSSFNPNHSTVLVQKVE